MYLKPPLGHAYGDLSGIMYNTKKRTNPYMSRACPTWFI